MQRSNALSLLQAIKQLIESVKCLTKVSNESKGQNKVCKQKAIQLNVLPSA